MPLISSAFADIAVSKSKRRKRLRTYGQRHSTKRTQDKKSSAPLWIEIMNITVLSLAALAITWCSYQSNLWNGIQTFSLARSNAAFRMAQEEEMKVVQLQLQDISIIVSFVDAVIANDTTKARVYMERTRPEMGSILAAWLKQDPLHNKNAPAHPAATEEYKQLVRKSFVPSENLKARGNDRWKEAEMSNHNSDDYVLMTVIFSIVMFFSGVAAKMANQKLSLLMNFISVGILIVMLGVLTFKMPLAGAYDRKSANTELINPT
jgi:hypothetical protein